MIPLDSTIQCWQRDTPNKTWYRFFEDNLTYEDNFKYEGNFKYEYSLK